MDPDLQIRGEGGGGGHPDPEIRGTPVSKKYFFALRASVCFKNKGGRGGPSPGSATGSIRRPRDFPAVFLQDVKKK